MVDWYVFLWSVVRGDTLHSQSHHLREEDVVLLPPCLRGNGWSMTGSQLITLRILQLRRVHLPITVQFWYISFIMYSPRIKPKQTVNIYTKLIILVWSFHLLNTFIMMYANLVLTLQLNVWFSNFRFNVPVGMCVHLKTYSWNKIVLILKIPLDLVLLLQTNKEQNGRADMLIKVFKWMKKTKEYDCFHQQTRPQGKARTYTQIVHIFSKGYLRCFSGNY